MQTLKSLQPLWHLLIWLMALFCGHDLTARQVVAITQIIEHPALDATRCGIMEELSRQGFTSDNLHILYQNAQGSLVTATQIVQHFGSLQPTVLVAISTASAQAAKQICKQAAIPLIFASVTDPIGSRLIEATPHSKMKVSGVSNHLPVVQSLQYFLQVLPTVKRIGLIYNPSESNSASLVQETKQATQQMGLQLRTAVIYRTNDVAMAMQSLLGKVDAVFINNDNTALAAFDIITKIGLQQRIPIFCSDTDMLSHQACAVIGCNQYQLGCQTGRMIAAILRGTAIEDLPFETAQTIESFVNWQVVEQLGLKNQIGSHVQNASALQESS